MVHVMVQNIIQENLEFQVKQLQLELDNLKSEKADLEILLEMIINHADEMEFLLQESNHKLQEEILERQRAEASLQATQVELRSLLEQLKKEKLDLELILDVAIKHGDIVGNFLLNQSIKDPLTGLYNRGFLEKSLLSNLHQSRMRQQNLSIIMIDIDHFRNFNNTFGHLAGDIVLLEISNFLLRNLRKSDIPCRYGGEELTIILPDTSLEYAKYVAEHLREGVRLLELKYGDQDLGKITISLGVSNFPIHGNKVDDLIKAADEALYLAKDRGRDKVVIADDVIICY